MKIACWNVNSVKAQLPLVLRWLEEAQPDIACLQKLKCVDEAFPRAEIETLGYHVETHGQKTYNGVALAKLTLEDVMRGLPGFEDEQARYIEAVISTDSGALRVASLYLPNGNPVDNPKYPYKLDWMAALEARVKELLPLKKPLCWPGIIMSFRSRKIVMTQGLGKMTRCFGRKRAAFRRLLNLGLTEAVAMRAVTGDDTYTFWDYQGGAWPKNKGIRIDHHLLSPRAADALTVA